MKTSLRFLLSIATGIGLATFTILSALASGIEADTTVIAFSLLAIYGLLEIAVLSYATPRFEIRPLGDRAVSGSAPQLARVSTVVALPASSGLRRAA